jgi:hypothetical protein
MPDLKLVSDSKQIKVKATETESFGVRVQADPQVATKGSHEIHFKVETVSTRFCTWKKNPASSESKSCN